MAICFFTVNFQRVENHIFDRNETGPTASLDAFGGDGFSDDIHDQMFKIFGTRRLWLSKYELAG